MGQACPVLALPGPWGQGVFYAPAGCTARRALWWLSQPTGLPCSWSRTGTPVPAADEQSVQGLGERLVAR